MDLNNFNNFNIATLEPYELIILGAIGIAVLLFGYKIKKAAFFVIWFLIGYVLTNTYLLSLVFQWVPQVNDNPELWNTLIPLAGGLLLALLGFSIEKFCVGGICFATSIIIASKMFGTDMQTLAIGAVIGVVVAGLAVMLLKPATIILTSLIGGYVICLIIFNLVKNLDQSTYFFLITGGLTILGSVFQFITTKHSD